MTSLAIKVENLGKRYNIGATRAHYQTLRDSFIETVTTPYRRARNLLGGQAYGAADLTQEIWALKDISFTVSRGEVIGIIGHNGAGKSTLLKVLSRITEPTEGYVDLYGRVGALLEVGTGFHQELTGRENVYLNGAILGMSRAEIGTKFEEIVNFSGVNKFIDTPVKFYSSGMKLRLGFAVAAHLEPEILVIDEVLAVGDAEFQKRCLGKMEEVSKQGRTVLFVSHNMEAVTSLTERCIALHQGYIVDEGATPQVVTDYLNRFGAEAEYSGYIDLRDAERPSKLELQRRVRANWMRITTLYGQETLQFEERQPICFELGFEIASSIDYVQWGIGIGLPMTRGQLFTIPSPEFYEVKPNEEHHVRVVIDPNFLVAGTYNINIKGFGNGSREEQINFVTRLTINPPSSGYDNLAHMKSWVSGNFRFDYSWSLQNTSSKPASSTLDA